MISRLQKSEKMAIFHLDLRRISRKNKSGGAKSAASIIAYRERCKIGEFNYSKKTDFVTSFCIFPTEFENSDFASQMRDPALFAQEIEKVENRKDSQLFEEIILALPHELDIEKNQKIIEELIGEFYVSKNQMARVCIHRSRSNLHAHILIPQRPIENTTNDSVGFGKKIREDFARGKPKTSEKVILLRSTWAGLVNQALSDIGENKRISHLSLRDLKKNAERVFDFELAKMYDRSTFYLPVSAYKRTEFIVSKDDRFSLDFDAMKMARTFSARRSELETLTLEDLRAEQDFWQKIESENRLRSGSLQLARKFAKRAEKSVFLKNEITKILGKNYETAGNRERSHSNSTPSNTRAQKHTTQLNLNSTSIGEYYGLNTHRHGSEARESDDSRDVYGRSRHQTNDDWECGRDRLGSENSSEFSGVDVEGRNPNPNAHQQREVFKIFSAGWHGQGHHSGFGECFKSRAASGRSIKSESNKANTRTPSLIPRPRRKTSR